MRHQTKSKTIGPRVGERLIAQLVEGQQAPADLAKANGLSLRALAEWAARPEHADVLAGLAHLAEVRTQLLLCRYRATAAATLIRIAGAEKPNELARKACVDLLKIDRPAFPSHAARESDEPDDPPAPSEQSILRALESLGREDG